MRWSKATRKGRTVNDAGRKSHRRMPHAHDSSSSTVHIPCLSAPPQRMPAPHLPRLLGHDLSPCLPQRHRPPLHAPLPQGRLCAGLACTLLLLAQVSRHAGAGDLCGGEWQEAMRVAGTDSDARGAAERGARRGPAGGWARVASAPPPMSVPACGSYSAVFVGVRNFFSFSCAVSSAAAAPPLSPALDASCRSPKRKLRPCAMAVAGAEAPYDDGDAP